MTYNPMDEEDSLYQSGVRGYQYFLHNRTPDTVYTTTSGGGAVGNTWEGLAVRPGSTSGDTAAIRTARYSGNPFQAGAFVLEMTFESWNALPFTDDYQLGIVGPGRDVPSIDPADGVFLDFETEEVVVNGIRRSITFPNQFERCAVTIENDDETGITVTLRHGGDEYVENFSSETTQVGATRCLGESNGGADEIRIGYMREALV